MFESFLGSAIGVHRWEALRLSISVFWWVLWGMSIEQAEVMVLTITEDGDDRECNKLVLWWSPWSASRLDAYWAEEAARESRLAAFRGE